MHKRISMSFESPNDFCILHGFFFLALYSYVSMKEKAVGREDPAAKPSAKPISADDREDEERVGLVGRRR